DEEVRELPRLGRRLRAGVVADRLLGQRHARDLPRCPAQVGAVRGGPPLALCILPMRGRLLARLVVLSFLALTACASRHPVEMRVRDPWQVAVVTVTDAGDVPRRSATDWRDEEGFPHFESYGDFLVTNDGAIVTPDARQEGTTIRLLAHLFYA